MDGTNLDFPDQSFDSVICRFALMYLPDPVRGLTGINRVLRRNGRVSAVIYGDNGSPDFSLAVSTVRKHLSLPASKSKAHQLGDIEVLKKVFKKGGFIDVETYELNLAIDLVSADECVQYLQATSPTLRDLIASLSDAETADVWEKVRHALKKFVRENKFELVHKIVVASATARKT
jgi:ubiquinone/menaquinone biosynthesis C-methylase UbiE